MGTGWQKTGATKLTHWAVSFAFVAFTTSCGQSNTDEDGSQIERFQLCPKSSDARAELNAIARSFAAEQQAKVYDRGAEAQDELDKIGSATLKPTKLPLVLLTIESPKSIRISITNLGLREKFALSIQVWEENDGTRKSEAFLDQVSRFWSIKKVEGGVRNDPPCPVS